MDKKEFKPFDIEHCPNCGYEGCRDCGEVELRDGKQTIRHWCEECGWESNEVYQVIHIPPEGEKNNADNS